MKFDKENKKNSIDLNSGNGSVDFTLTSSSSCRNYGSSNTDNSSNVNNNNNHDVQENKKLKEKNNKIVFILSNRIVKHLEDYEISSPTENCKVYIIGYPATITQCMKGYPQPTT